MEKLKGGDENCTKVIISFYSFLNNIIFTSAQGNINFVENLQVILTVLILM